MFLGSGSVSPTSGFGRVHEDKEIDPESLLRKQWKKLHFVGTIDVDPQQLKPPAAEWRAREADPVHVKVLQASLQRTQSTNNKGVKLVVQNDALWREVQRTAEGNDAFTGFITTGCTMHKQLVENGLMPFAGDQH